jgi:single-strand DNA-binding protein
MTDTITLTGLVATEPKHITTSEGLAITSFRLASSLSRYDRATGTWIEVGTNWYTVSAFRRLAVSAATSLAKGHRVIVTGRLRLRDWKTDDKAGMTIEVDADALGHDLNWGTATYTRTMKSSSAGDAGSDTPADDAELGSDEEPPADPLVMAATSGVADEFPSPGASAGDGTSETPF